MCKFDCPNLNDIMIKIYTTNWCPSCNAAKSLLDSIDIAYKEINIEEKKFSRAQLEELTGGYTVPQIIINNKCIGGYEKLLYLYQNNKLQEILNAK